MEIRKLGDSNLSVGVIGFGCEGLLGKPQGYFISALDMMEAAGANCIDLYSSNPAMRSNLGTALTGRRNKFILQGHFCSIWEGNQYKCSRDLQKTRRAFDDQLSRLGTDYLDIGMIHYVDSYTSWQQVLDNGILGYALELKRQGVIHALGLSSHNPILAKKAIKEGGIEVLMFSINPCYDLQPADDNVEELWNRDKYKGNLINMDPDRASLYEICMKQGVGITVMKAFGGGDLLHKDKSLAGMALTPHQAISYALDRPAVSCVLVGAHSLNELETALAYAQASDDEKNYADILAKFPRISWKGHCMYCGHCAPCNAQIDIAMVTKLLNLAKSQPTVPETVREHYAALPHKADECLECGDCETRYPFEVAIRENMAQAKRVFSRNFK